MLEGECWSSRNVFALYLEMAVDGRARKRERDARRNNTFKIASRLTNHKSCKQTKKINNNNAEIFKCWMEEFISPVERGVYECMQEQKRK